MIAAAALMLTACTSMQWVNPDATPEQFQQDQSQCDEQAWREARHRAWAHQPLTPMLMRDALGRHYIAPFGPFAGSPFDDRFFDESRLAHFCMRAKGYELRPVERKRRG